MASPISLRLDEEVQAGLEEAARARGIALSTYLRELAAAEARRLRRERIRAQSQAVAAHIAAEPAAAAFMEDWTAPTPPGDAA